MFFNSGMLCNHFTFEWVCGTRPSEVYRPFVFPDARPEQCLVPRCVMVRSSRPCIPLSDVFASCLLKSLTRRWGRIISTLEMMTIPPVGLFRRFSRALRIYFYGVQQSCGRCYRFVLDNPSAQSSSNSKLSGFRQVKCVYSCAEQVLITAGVGKHPYCLPKQGGNGRG